MDVRRHLCAATLILTKQGGGKRSEIYTHLGILWPPYSVRPCPLLLLVVRGGHYHPRVVGREYVYVGRSSEAGARAKIIWDRSAGGAAAAYIIGAWKFRGMSG